VARALPLALLATAVLGAAGLAAGRGAVPANPTREGDVYRWRGRLLYRFHATFRDEKLFDPGADPFETRDLGEERPADLARMRTSFLRRLGLRDLEAVPVSEEEWRRLAGEIGYVGGGGGR
jgi:hypothetical protein